LTLPHQHTQYRTQRTDFLRTFTIYPVWSTFHSSQPEYSVWNKPRIFQSEYKCKGEIWNTNNYSRKRCKDATLMRRRRIGESLNQRYRDIARERECLTTRQHSY